MTIESVIGDPPRLEIGNVETGESIEVQFNPEKFEITASAEFEQIEVQGGSYQPLHFKQAGNPTIPLEIKYIVQDEWDDEELRTAEKFLWSLYYPRRGADSVSGHAPPRTLILWPTWLSIRCHVRGITERANRFNAYGRPIEADFILQLEEFRDGQIFSEDVREQGLRRSYGPIGRDESEG